MLMLSCRCGPRPQTNTFSVNDAVRTARFDPTGTLDIRAKFRREMDGRWGRLRKLAIDAIDRNDALGLGVSAKFTDIAVPFIGYDRVKSFQTWIDAALNEIVLGQFGTWTSLYLRMTAGRALERTAELVGKNAWPDSARVRALESLTVVELQGVMEAVSQQAIRAYAAGMLSKQRPSQVARSVAAVINAIGKVRGRMVVDTMVIKTFSAVTLDAFRSAGVSHVGLIPEKVRGVKAVGDAARKTKQARGKGGQFRPYTKMPSAKKIREIVKAEQERVAKLSMVEVLTAGDELVCQACDDISEDGPYTIDEAEGLIPAHPNCRCAFVPASDERFSNVRSD